VRTRRAGPGLRLDLRGERVHGTTRLRFGELFTLHLVDVHLDGPKPYVLIQYGSRKRARNQKTNERTGEYLTWEEQQKLLKHAGEDPERHLIAFAMGTGLRLGEPRLHPTRTTW
jgi:hypothetical protein